MHDSKNLIEMIGGVPVVAAPPEIDTTTAERLRAILLEAAGHALGNVHA